MDSKIITDNTSPVIPSIATPIENHDQFIRLITELHEIGKIYHPEDPAETIINASGNRIFTDAEAALLNQRMTEAYNLEWPSPQLFECPCHIVLSVFHGGYYDFKN